MPSGTRGRLLALLHCPLSEAKGALYRYTTDSLTQPHQTHVQVLYITPNGNAEALGPAIMSSLADSMMLSTLVSNYLKPITPVLRGVFARGAGIEMTMSHLAGAVRKRMGADPAIQRSRLLDWCASERPVRSRRCNSWRPEKLSTQTRAGETRT